MAPVKFNEHSCATCQQFVLYRLKNATKDDLRDVRGYRDFRIIFDFKLPDLKNGAERGCDLCSWIVDEECIAIEDIAAHVTRNQQAYSLPSPAKRTFRNVATKNNDLNDCSLFLEFFEDPASDDLLDILDIDFFGLWSPSLRRCRYRTRHGFRVQTTTDDPAAKYIQTRPIEDDPISTDNIQRMLSWSRECLSEHNTCPKLSLSFMPKRVVEVLDRNGSHCLRLRHSAGMPLSHYIALSYCWGGEQPVKLKKDLSSQWFNVIPSANLPQTLQDAVSVCRHLGVRYVWIDALCIIQDDDQDKAREIAQMPCIYQHAYVTVAAASSIRAEQGFLGKRAYTNVPAFKLPFRSPDGQVGSATLLRLDIDQNPLDDRGWTLQERLLSSRILEFGYHQLRWVCRGTQNMRGFTDGWTVNPEYHISKKNVVIPDLPTQAFDLGQSIAESQSSDDTEAAGDDWCSLVKIYTNRKLGNATDRILAISGLAERYSAVLDDKYIAGLWWNETIEQLLWEVTLSYERPLPRDFQGPSWSWTGVNGPVDFPAQFDIGNPSEDSSMAEVIECNPVPVESGAPFGAVKPESCTLVLRGKVLPAKLMKLPPPPLGLVHRIRDEERDRNGVLVAKMNDQGGSCAFEVSLDLLDETTTSKVTGSEGTIIVLEIQSRFTAYGWSSIGLVLRRGVLYETQKHLEGAGTGKASTNTVNPTTLDESIYHRIGMYDYSSLQDDDNKGDLSQKGDWFANCVPYLVKIL